jgi:hypothetical protein
VCLLDREAPRYLISINNPVAPTEPCLDCTVYAGVGEVAAIARRTTHTAALRRSGSRYALWVYTQLSSPATPERNRPLRRPRRRQVDNIKMYLTSVRRALKAPNENLGRGLFESDQGQATSQKMAFFKVTVVNTSNPTNFI